MSYYTDNDDKEGARRAWGIVLFSKRRIRNVSTSEKEICNQRHTCPPSARGWCEGGQRADRPGAADSFILLYSYHFIDPFLGNSQLDLLNHDEEIGWGRNQRGKGVLPQPRSRQTKV